MEVVQQEVLEDSIKVEEDDEEVWVSLEEDSGGEQVLVDEAMPVAPAAAPLDANGNEIDANKGQEEQKPSCDQEQMEEKPRVAAEEVGVADQQGKQEEAQRPSCARPEEAQEEVQVEVRHGGAQEIQQESIKNKLKEIISEIEKEVVMADLISEQLRPEQVQQEESMEHMTSCMQSEQVAPHQQPQEGELPPLDTDVTAPTSWPSPPVLLRPSQLPPRPISMPSSLYAENDAGYYGCDMVQDVRNGDSPLPSGFAQDSQEEEEHESYSETGTQKISLEKLFTPASDFTDGNLSPTRRRMYANSAFYSSDLHPSMQEQVELARKISASLCDSSNQQSKGQSMYVKRMRRSAKWVHEGTGMADEPLLDGSESGNDDRSLSDTGWKMPNSVMQDLKLRGGGPNLKLVMNPSGKVIDLQTLRTSGLYNEHGPLSPDICFDLVKDLNATTGKGAQLFAKRRKKSEKWVVDENTVKQFQTTASEREQVTSGGVSGGLGALQTPSGQQLPPPSFIDRGRVEHVQKMNQIQEQFTKPRLRMVKSPWEAALETGSVDTAFEDLRCSRQPAPGQYSFVDTGFQQPSPGQYSFVDSGFQQPSPGSLPPFQTDASYQQQPALLPCWDSYGTPKKSPPEEEVPAFRSVLDHFETRSKPHPQATAAYFVPRQSSPTGTCPPKDVPLPPLSTCKSAGHIPSSYDLIGRNHHHHGFNNNYNTAPRGWSQQLNFYRPVTFS